ncbi:hypothetical protein EW146_g6715 [Bondarzewia mesenterica]|uniref:BZIP domain-containing protein n=1 Tax=Bondarzewia mesenterica TaxID=1095465 RepID=A0A4S4LPL3_9AGAM|nr:hypothetical protein EW146_g6715 [Bondarzewia mesenterica]
MGSRMPHDAELNVMHYHQSSANAQTDAYEITRLTASSPSHRPSRLHTLRPLPAQRSHPLPPAIPANPSNNFINPNQDVRPLPVNRSPAQSYPPSDLAAHHGIPQSLPPPPTTTPRRELVSENPADQFANLRSQYLTMLAQENVDHPMPAVESHAPALDLGSSAPPTSEDDAAAQAIISVFQGNKIVSYARRRIAHDLGSAYTASPEFEMLRVFETNYLTSPGESPLDDMLTTPALGTDDFMGPDVWTSPMLGMSGDFDDMPSLFPDMPPYPAYDAKVPTSTPSLRPTFDDMYTMPSPDTPALDPASLHSSPALCDTKSATKLERKNLPTGTRKNVTPESLVPIDAPIQARKYVTPSQTSRKELPATFARKRARSQAFGDGDEDEDDSQAPTLSEEDAIKAKRLQNTLAARRSRKRKLEYQRELEEALQTERQEKEMWKARALALEVLLRDKGHIVPPMFDS